MLTASRAVAALGWLALAVIQANCSAVPVSPLNSSSITPSKTSLGDVPSVITPAPILPSFPGQVIPNNTCSHGNDTHSLLWTPCKVYAGTVQLSYWPTNDNYSYPSTFYDSKLDYTFTSPSVYMVVNTLYALNECGRLGPTFTSRVFAFDLTNVSTLAPYTDHTASTSRTARQLYLSDLGVDCPTSVNWSKLRHMTHPMKNGAVRCNPSLVIPIDIKRAGYPYWKHCGNDHFKFGLFDPPYAIPRVDAVLDPVTSTAVGPAGSPIDPPAAAPKPTAVPDRPAATPAANSQPPDKPPNPNQPVNPNVDASFGPADVVDKPTSTMPSNVDTVSRQIISLGPSGLVIVNPDATSTSSIVTSVGGMKSGPEIAPAYTTVVYQGNTLTAGGAAVTVTSAVMVPPTGGAGVNISGHVTVVTASAGRVTGSLIVVLVTSLLALSSYTLEIWDSMNRDNS